MTNERRNDIGAKILTGAIVIVIGAAVVGLVSQASENTVVNATQTEQIKGIKEDLGDLKVGQNTITNLLLDR